MDRRSEKAPVSAVVLSYNEAANIASTLKSVVDWCEEVFVVDSGSTDGTQEIARKFTEHIHINPYIDHSSQWSWALSKLKLNCPWVLMLDSDFVVSANLRKKIEDTLKGGADGVGGFYLRHRYVFRGQPIRFGGTKKWWLRLVRRECVRVETSELVDFRVLVTGKTKQIDGMIYEDNKKEYDIDFWIDKHQKFAGRMAAEELLRRSGTLQWSVQATPWGNPDERVIWMKKIWLRLPSFVRPFMYFFYRYVVCLGFVDGWRGFLFHFLQGFWFRLIVDLRIEEFERRLRRGEITLERVRTLVGRK